MESFLQSIRRTVNPTFSDVQVNNRYYRVDPKLRGDRCYSPRYSAGMGLKICRAI